MHGATNRAELNSRFFYTNYCILTSKLAVDHDHHLLFAISVCPIALSTGGFQDRCRDPI